MSSLADDLMAEATPPSLADQLANEARPQPSQADALARAALVSAKDSLAGTPTSAKILGGLGAIGDGINYGFKKLDWAMSSVPAVVADTAEGWHGTEPTQDQETADEVQNEPGGFRNLKAWYHGAQTSQQPTWKEVNESPDVQNDLWASVGSKVSRAGAELLPRIYLMRGLGAAGLGNAASGALAFAPTEQGFSGLNAAMGAAIPGIQQVSKAATGAVLARMGGGALPAAAEKAVEEMGGLAGIQAFNEAIQAPEKVQQFKTDPQAFWHDLAADTVVNLGFLGLSAPGWRAGVPSETQNFLNRQPAVQAPAAADANPEALPKGTVPIAPLETAAAAKPGASPKATPTTPPTAEELATEATEATGLDRLRGANGQRRVLSMENIDRLNAQPPEVQQMMGDNWDLINNGNFEYHLNVARQAHGLDLPPATPPEPAAKPTLPAPVLPVAPAPNPDKEQADPEALANEAIPLKPQQYIGAGAVPAGQYRVTDAMTRPEIEAAQAQAQQEIHAAWPQLTDAEREAAQRGRGLPERFNQRTPPAPVQTPGQPPDNAARPPLVAPAAAAAARARLLAKAAAKTAQANAPVVPPSAPRVEIEATPEERAKIKQNRAEAAARAAAELAKQSPRSEPTPAAWTPPKAEPVEPVPAEAMDGDTLTDAVKENGGLTGPDLDTALSAMRKGTPASKIVAGFDQGGQHDELANVLEEIADARDNGEAGHYRALRAAYQKTFKAGEPKADKTLAGIQEAAEAGRIPIGGTPEHEGELIQRAWQEASRPTATIDREATAAAQEAADFEAFHSSLKLVGDRIHSGDFPLAEVRTDKRGNKFLVPSPEAEGLPPEYQTALLAKAGIEVEHGAVGSPLPTYFSGREEELDAAARDLYGKSYHELSRFNQGNVQVTLESEDAALQRRQHDQALSERVHGTDRGDSAKPHAERAAGAVRPSAAETVAELRREWDLTRDANANTARVDAFGKLQLNPATLSARSLRRDAVVQRIGRQWEAMKQKALRERTEAIEGQLAVVQPHAEQALARVRNAATGEVSTKALRQLPSQDLNAIWHAERLQNARAAALAAKGRTSSTVYPGTEDYMLRRMERMTGLRSDTEPGNEEWEHGSPAEFPGMATSAPEFDPTILRDLTQMAAPIVEGGATSFPEYARAMGEALGGAYPEYYHAAYEQVRFWTEAWHLRDLMTPQEEAETYDHTGQRTDRDSAAGRGPQLPGTVGGAGGNVRRRPGLRVVDFRDLPAPRAFISSGEYTGPGGAGLDEVQRFAANAVITAFEAGKPAYLLGDGTGVGKTGTELAIANQIAQRTKLPSLIVTQSVPIIENRFKQDAIKLGIPTKDVHFITYSDLSAGKVPPGKFGVVVYDEAHNLKNAGSAREAASQLVAAQHKVFATATPMDSPSHASYFLSELTGRTREQVAKQLGFHYEQHTVNGQVRTMAVLDKNVVWHDVVDRIKRLRNQAVQSGQMIRREYPFYGSAHLRQAPQYSREAADEQARIMKYWDDQIAMARPGTNYRRNLAGQKTLELSRWAEIQKLPPIRDAVLQDLADGKHVIVFGEGYNDTPVKGLGKVVPGFLAEMAKALDERGIKYAKVFEDSPQEKARAAAQFQRNLGTKVLLATPKSGGAGLDMDDQIGNAPRQVHSATLNFSADVFDQMLGRVSRRNSASPADFHIWQNQDSFSDRRRMQVADRKLRVLRNIQAGEDLDTSDFDTEDEHGTPDFGQGGFSFDAPESSAEKAARLAADEQRQNAAKLAARQQRRLAGDTGDLGQGDLLGGASDLWGARPNDQTEHGSPGTEHEAVPARGSLTPTQRRETLRTATPVEIDSTALGQPKTQGFLDRVRAVYKSLLPAVNAIDGHKINFVMTGLKKLASHSADERTLQIVPKLSELIKSAVPLYAEPDRSGTTGMTWHVYGARAVLDGKPTMVKLVVREEVKGKYTLDYFDDGSASNEELFIKPDGGLADPLSMQEQASRRLDRDKIYQWWHTVKADELEPGAPAVPAGGLARLPVELDRKTEGQVGIPQINAALEAISRAAGGSTPIRQGRFYSQKYAGIYKSRAEVVRMKRIDDLPTAAHEIAHDLSKQVFGSVSAGGDPAGSRAISKELEALGVALYGSVKPSAGYGGEGWAEYLRHWLSADDAATVAPKMTKWFEGDFLPANPEIAKALTNARELITTHRLQGAAARAQAQLGREPGAFRQIAKALGQFVSYKAQMESFAPLERLAKAAEAKRGPLAPAENPFLLASFKRGSAGATVERMANEHMLDLWGNPVGPSLKEAFAPVQGQRAETMLLAFAKAAEARWTQTRQVTDPITGVKSVVADPKNPGISLADARHIMQTLSTPQREIAVQKWRDWHNGLLNYLVQADPGMQPLVDKWKANSFYMPLARMIDPAKAKAAAAAAASNPFYRMRGSGLPVKDLLDQTLVNAARLVNRANRALVTSNIVKLANVEGMGHLIEAIPKGRVRNLVSLDQVRAQLEDLGIDTSAMAKDRMLEYWTPADLPKGSAPIVAVGRPGARQWFQVDPELYQTLDGLQTYSLKQAFPGLPYLGKMLDLVLGAPTRTFRLGTTALRPGFELITQPARSLALLLAQSENPARSALNYPGSLAGVLKEGFGGKPGPYSQAFKDLGAHMGQPLGTDINYTKRVSNELFQGRLVRTVMNPLDHFRQLLSLPEGAPRIAELKTMADKVGWTPGRPMSPDQAVQMALAAKKVTVDFSAAGDASRVLNQAIPFYNVTLQHARAYAQAFANHPVRSSLLAATLFTAPTLLNWWQNKDKEWYSALPWKERYLYTWLDDGKNLWKIARPFEWGMTAMALPEAAADSWYRRDPTGVKQAMGAIFKDLNPVDYPVLLKLAKEQWQNRIDYFNRPIVPQSEVGLPASQQRGAYTSKLALMINQAMPSASPRRVDAFLHGYFGGAGNEAINLLGLGAPKSAREAEPSDLPAVGTLFRSGGQFNSQNQHVTDFYDRWAPIQAQLEAWSLQSSRARITGQMPTVEPPDWKLSLKKSIGVGTKQEPGAAPSIKALMLLANSTTNSLERARLYQEAGEVAQRAVEAFDRVDGFGK